MELKDLGYNTKIENLLIDVEKADLEIGRVIREHKERYLIKTCNGEYEAEITGNMRFGASSREDFPAVGDWVLVAIYEPDMAIIHQILPRYSVLRRQAVAHFGETQIIATNIDYAFIVLAVDRDFNINRLERYLALCNASDIEAIVILSKADLLDGPSIEALIGELKARVPANDIIAVSNQTFQGYQKVNEIIKAGSTYCLLGSSGVGKSSLLNNLVGDAVMKTQSISSSTHKGKHSTTHREMIFLKSGGIIIDNPGMKEVGIVDSSDGLELTFGTITELSRLCKYPDCTHTSESGCKVIEAVEKGDLNAQAYQNYLKIYKEREFFESSQLEKKKKDKAFGKMLKGFKKDKKNNEFL